MAAFTIYRSTDASAPVLTGTVGDLVNLLDKCLVTGYGSKTGAGWTKPYTGTNAADFKMGGGNQFYLSVNDNGPGAGTAKEARVRGYEAMTASATGTAPFPTVAQMAAGVIVRKSTTADATARSWIIAADDRTMYLFIATADSVGNYAVFCFGDTYSLLAADGYRTMIMGRTTENLTSMAIGNETVPNSGIVINSSPTSVWTDQAGHYFARQYTGTGGPVLICKSMDMSMKNTSTSGAAIGEGGMSYPNPVDGGIYLSRIYMQTNVGTRRGWMRGFWHWQHAASAVVDGDTFNGTGDLAGRTFLVVKFIGTTSVAIIETSNTLDTSS